MDKMQYVYIVKCSDDTLYTGYTNDLKKRIHMHNSGKGAKYTKHRTPLILLYYEVFEEKGDALRREYAIKKLTRVEKLELINRLNDTYCIDEITAINQSQQCEC